MRFVLALTVFAQVALQAAAASAQTWYWCEPARAYYPYVARCPEPWRLVNPSGVGSQPYGATQPPPLAGQPTPLPSTMPNRFPVLGDALDDWCKNVRLPSSIAICSDGELRALALERQHAYDEAKARLSTEQQKALLAEQNGWVQSYPRACGLTDAPPSLPLALGIKDCMVQAGRARIAHLRAYLAEPSSRDAILAPGGALMPSAQAPAAAPLTHTPPAAVVSPAPSIGGTSQDASQSEGFTPIGAVLIGLVLVGISVAIWRAHVRAKIRRHESELICEYFNLVNASRRFPAVEVPIVLEAGEFGLLATSAILCEMRAHRATSGGRVRIAKGVRVGVRRYEYSYRQLEPVASGTLVVTNRRVVFRSDARPMHFALGELLDVKYDRYLRLLIRRRQTPIILSIAHGNLAMLLIRVFAEGAFRDGRLPDGLVLSAQPSASGRGVDLNFDRAAAAITTAVATPRL